MTKGSGGEDGGEFSLVGFVDCSDDCDGGDGDEEGEGCGDGKSFSKNFH